MKLNKTEKRLIQIVIVLLVLVVCLFFYGTSKNSEIQPETAIESTPTPTPELTAQQKDYQEKIAINPDYVGTLKFDSGLIEQNVVQCSENNEKYLTTSWDLQEDEKGSIFFDYRNTDDDQNLILYGHYVYYDDSAMFSKLELLLDESNYEANKMITLYIGEDVVHHYLITDVFYYDANTDTPDYHEPNYTEEDFNTYYSQVSQMALYITGESISYTDRWLTLQTCVRDHDELREIVLAKEIYD